MADSLIEPGERATVDPLAVDHLQGDLKARTVRGGLITVSAQALRTVLQITALMVLARLLGPEEYGLVGMVAAVTGFVALFSDVGLSMATVQRPQLSRDQVSTLFWFTLLVSLGLVLVTAALAPLLAWFYDEPRLTKITLALAVAFPIVGLGTQHRALLQRQMRFGSLALVDAGSLAVSVCVAIVAAVLGAGYWSLIFMHLSLPTVSTALAWSQSGFMPGRPRRGSGVRPMLAFGGNLTGFNVLNYAARNVDNVLIGWAWGASALGLYTRAYGLMMLPLGVIGSPLAAVAIPGLGRLQEEPDRFGRYYLRALTTMAWATMPLGAALVVSADEIILAVLGPSWSGAGPIFRMLALSFVAQPICNSAGWLYISRGRTDRLLRWGLVASPLTVVAIALGLRGGPKGVALAYSVAVLLLTLPCMALAIRGTRITMGALGRAVWSPALAAILGAAVGLALRGVTTGWGSPWISAGVVTLGVAAVAAVGLLLSGDWRVMDELRKAKP